MEIKRVKYESQEYRESLMLRNTVLRKPLGMDIYAENLPAESNDIHLVAVANNKIVGTLVLSDVGNGKVRMRQVAVSPEMRNCGIGRTLVIESEKIAVEEGYIIIILHARESAVNFYRKLSYEVVSGEFMELGIAHYKMQKKLDKL